MEPEGQDFKVSIQVTAAELTGQESHNEPEELRTDVELGAHKTKAKPEG